MLQIVHYRDPLPCALRVCIEENVPCVLSTNGRVYDTEANGAGMSREREREGDSGSLASLLKSSTIVH